MKRSNLLLAATTGLLAVASFAFAKNHKSTFRGGCLTAGKHLCPFVHGYQVTTVQANASKCGPLLSQTVVTTINCAVRLRNID